MVLLSDSFECTNLHMLVCTCVASRNPYVTSDFEDEDSESDDYAVKPMRVDIDLGLSAYANSRKYGQL